MISYGFKSGSTPAILLSVGRLVLRATVAANRLTSKFLMQSVVFWLGFWDRLHDEHGREVEAVTSPSVRISLPSSAAPGA